MAKTNKDTKKNKTKKKSLRTIDNSAKKEKAYNSSSLRAAVIEVKNGSIVYKAAKKFCVPWSTLKACCSCYHQDPTSTSELKRGKPFILPAKLEVEFKFENTRKFVHESSPICY